MRSRGVRGVGHKGEGGRVVAIPRTLRRGYIYWSQHSTVEGTRALMCAAAEVNYSLTVAVTGSLWTGGGLSRGSSVHLEAFTRWDSNQCVHKCRMTRHQPPLDVPCGPAGRHRRGRGGETSSRIISPHTSRESPANNFMGGSKWTKRGADRRWQKEAQWRMVK